MFLNLCFVMKLGITEYITVAEYNTTRKIKPHPELQRQRAQILAKVNKMNILNRQVEQSQCYASKLVTMLTIDT